MFVDTLFKHYLVDTTIGVVNIILPAAPDDGWQWRITKKEAPSHINVTVSGGALISGQATWVINKQWDTMVVTYDLDNNIYIIS